MIQNNKPQESTLNDLIHFLEQQPGSRPTVIAESIGVSRQYVQKLLAKHHELFSVAGTGPNRFYRLSNKTIDTSVKDLNIATSKKNDKDNVVIDKNFYGLTPLGEELIGLEGFEKWCYARDFNITTKKIEYIKILKKYYPVNFKSPIDFTNKLKSTFTDLALKKVWAIDYYNIEVFGKTKLGINVMIAKQTGDQKTTQQLVETASKAVDLLVARHSIDAVAFVSPTIQRQAQLMGALESGIANTFPRVRLYKVGARILIAQKTLKSLDDRVLNAEQTFIVESKNKYNNILIIDDALGSGATLNEIAKQILNKKIAKKCYGLVLVASPSDYEVINEV